MADMFGLLDIAERLNVEVTTVRRLVAREIDSLQLQIHRGKGDKILLTKEDTENLIASYQSRRGPVSSTIENTTKFDRFGCFYIIQLVPEALPNRVKIGFADNLESRLADHQTAAPTARVVKSWPCKRSWDYAAMDSITRDGCKLVLNEVYEGNIDGFVERGEVFFSLMPDPDVERELSEYSPLYESEEEEV